MVSPASARGFITFGSFGVILTFTLLHYREAVYNWRCCSRKRGGISLLLISIVITAGFLLEFISVWFPSRKLRALANALHIPHYPLLQAIGIVAAVGALVFIHEVLLFCRNPKFDSTRSSFLNGSLEDPEAPITTKRPDSWQEKGFILLCAVVSMTLCSCSSPLYPMNDWVDVNAFFTVGKGMFRGLVPYRDLFDHKGPYLFLVYGLASLISPDSLIGGYLLEIITAYVYLLYSYRIACFHIKKRTIIIVPLIAMIAFTSRAFVRGGSPEEFCLALTAYSLWLFLLDYRDHDLRPLHFLLLGAIIGCIFWTKFTLIGMYIGWYIWMLLTMIRDKKGKALAARTAMMFCGFVLATVPWVIYFGVHGAVKDWLEVYLYDNLFSYSLLHWSPRIPFILRTFISLSTGLTTAFTNNPVTMVLCTFFTANMLQKRNGRLAGLYALILLCTLTSLFIGGRAYQYYSMPMSVFLAPSLALVIACTPGRLQKRPQVKAPVLAILYILCLVLITPNRSFMRCKKEDLAQYQFRKIITENSTDATLLNYGQLDQGFYTVCDILPNCRAFYIANALTRELIEEQNRYVTNGLCDYIITCSEIDSPDNPNISTSGSSNAGQNTVTPENRFELYDLIAASPGTANGHPTLYRLYRLKPLTE